MAHVNVIPGGSVVMRIQVRKYDGSLAVLDGGTISTTITASGVSDEAADQIVAPDSQTRIVVVSGAQTAERAGKPIRVRALVTPLNSYETIGSEAFINVERI